MSKKDQIATVARRAYWREADARVMVEAWRASDEPLAGFAQRHGVQRGRLSRWASRLASAAPTPVHFHPVRVAPSGETIACDEGAPIEIEIRAGRHVCIIRVRTGFAPDDLRQVLAVVDETPTC